MSLGTMLVSLGVVLGVGVFVAWPFRPAGGAAMRDGDVDRLLDLWVRRAQVEQLRAARPAAEVPSPVEPSATQALGPAAVSVAEAGTVDDSVHFCPYCGRRVEPDHMFCPKCGRQLVKGEAS
jgi:ribosomal protein S27AE